MVSGNSCIVLSSIGSPRCCSDPRDGLRVGVRRADGLVLTAVTQTTGSDPVTPGASDVPRRSQAEKPRPAKIAGARAGVTKAQARAHGEVRAAPGGPRDQPHGRRRVPLLRARPRRRRWRAGGCTRIPALPVRGSVCVRRDHRLRISRRPPERIRSGRGADGRAHRAHRQGRRRRAAPDERHEDPQPLRRPLRALPRRPRRREDAPRPSTRWRGGCR